MAETAPSPAATVLAALLVLLLFVAGVAVYCAEQTRYAINEIKHLEKAIVLARDEQDAWRFRLAHNDSLHAIADKAHQMGFRYPP